MVSAIIVAGGSGRRMGGDLKKQYLTLSGVPILTRTLKVFDGCDGISAIFLVVPESDFSYCRKTVLGGGAFNKEIVLVPGGAERQESVRNGLDAAGDAEELVLIHDGVRPFVAPSDVERCIGGAEKTGACIMALPTVDTVKRVDARGGVGETLDRKEIWLAQTPQVFSRDLILAAHDRALSEGFTGTDDASLLERYGERVTVVEGKRTNIKITTREDLRLAGAFLDAGIV